MRCPGLRTVSNTRSSRETRACLRIATLHQHDDLGRGSTAPGLQLAVSRDHLSRAFARNELSVTKPSTGSPNDEPNLSAQTMTLTARSLSSSEYVRSPKEGGSSQHVWRDAGAMARGAPFVPDMARRRSPADCFAYPRNILSRLPAMRYISIS